MPRKSKKQKELMLPEGHFQEKYDTKFEDGDVLEHLLEDKHDSVDEMILEALFDREDKEYYSELPEAKLDEEKKRNPKTSEGDEIQLAKEYVRIKKKEHDANSKFYKQKNRDVAGRGYVSASAYDNTDLDYIHRSEEELGIPGTTEMQLSRSRSVPNRPGYAKPQNVDTLHPKTTSPKTQTMPPMMPEYTAWSAPKDPSQLGNSLPKDGYKTLEGDLEEGKARIPHKMISKEKARQPAAPASKYSPKVTPKSRNNK